MTKKLNYSFIVVPSTETKIFKYFFRSSIPDYTKHFFRKVISKFCTIRHITINVNTNYTMVGNIILHFFSQSRSYWVADLRISNFSQNCLKLFWHTQSFYFFLLKEHLLYGCLVSGVFKQGLNMKDSSPKYNFRTRIVSSTLHIAWKGCL